MTTPEKNNAIEAPIAYIYDEDGYYFLCKPKQESPRVKGKFLTPLNSTEVEPEIPDGYFAHWSGAKWEYEKIPSTAEEFVGAKISHKSQTARNQLLRQLLQKLVEEDSDHYRVIRGSEEEGLWWSVERIPEKTQDEKDLEAAKLEEQKAMAYLNSTDYVAVKIAEGVATKDEYADVLQKRAETRELINGLRATQETLTAKIGAASD
ncbi:MAG TPA: hypothetical protein IAC66_07635 [Candidatus Aphodousia gallistercoris]|nr:hypothetical protein [Candidatus Aphodousia gallistercoris]